MQAVSQFLQTFSSSSHPRMFHNSLRDSFCFTWQIQIMKPKLLLCLALVLSGGLFGCSNNVARLPASNVKLSQAESPRFVYLVGMFKNPGHIAWTNGMTLKDALNVRPLDDFARSMIRIAHTDGSVVQYNWSAEHPLTNNPFLKPGDRVISPEVFY